jgi:hypothetical protein
MPEYIDTLICDAIRPEANQKMSLLGVLGDEIFVPQVPTQLVSLAFFERWKRSEGDIAGQTFRFSFQIGIPGLGAPIVLPERNAVVPDSPRATMNFVAQIQGFPIPQEGIFEFRTLIDGQQRHVLKFFVGLPAVAKP